MMSTKFTTWRGFATKMKLVPHFDQEIIKKIEDKEIHPRRHPGRLMLPPIQVPEKIFDSIKIVIQGYSAKSLKQDGNILKRYLRDRRKPSETKEIAEKTQMLQGRVEEKFNRKGLPIWDEKTTQKATKEVILALLRHTYVWAATDFSDYLCYPYLVSRSAAEYAILISIFKEISQREPLFQPESIFDFGSGVGTVIWASQSTWENSIKEYFCVDSSAKMNDIAKQIISGCQIDGKPTINAQVYHRQFLPASIQRKYNVVVSAFSLLELPDSKARLETISNLWARTEDYLVLVEMGNKGGHEVINEARDFLLGTFSRRKSDFEKAHVFSPCPHDKLCPKASLGDPCTFQSLYTELPLDRKMHRSTETYSYVVLKKGKRDEKDPQWPRIVQPVLVRTQHTRCRICTADGKFEEIIFTKSRNQKFPYWCARMSAWGDRLPINAITQENEEVNFNKSQKNVQSSKDAEKCDVETDFSQREVNKNCETTLQPEKNVDVSCVEKTGDGESSNKNI